ncbi:ATP synthase F1 subunit delta [Crocosphaera sp. UHCC 0190]|uniref:ATP synthase F1 subunit delta n=1 Tax=Crocosphaera sp. UHCC 0190 TaxID=3110246 RepID=UPI002B219726|nr:ATP synthase F1 subunit delta [Crocosphaera sp. UHCC 0190]MEA5510682.1 ATP synthase F1 subunit delta [Crocosphaera sp. UHCC 0190]
MKGSLLSKEIAEPYAQALMSLAESHHITESIGEDCRAILEMLEDCSDLRAFVSSPIIKEEDKRAVLTRILGRDIHHYLRNFVMLLVDKRRITFLEDICQQYLALLRKLTNTVLAEVTASTELNDEQRRAVSDKIKVLTGARSVEMKTYADPDLIGGVIIKVGSQVFDASLRGQLRRIGLTLGGAS